MCSKEGVGVDAFTSKGCSIVHGCKCSSFVTVLLFAWNLFSLRPSVQQFSIWITIEKRIGFVTCEAMLTRPSRIPKAKTCFVPGDVWWWKVWGERPNPRPFYSRWPAGHWANVAVPAKSGRRLIGAWDASQDAHIEQSSLDWSPRWQSWNLLTMMKIADDGDSNSWQF